MQHSILQKMGATFQKPVEYYLRLGEERIPLNSLLGKTIRVEFLGEQYCTQCDRKISKTFQQGYCFPCYRRLLECNLCLIHPERCRYYEGLCCSGDWAHEQCIQPHIVYLANTSGLKVGITRADPPTSRWVDQGATQGLPILKTQNRYQAGLVEVLLKKHVRDKTSWQQMLKADNHILDLAEERDTLLGNNLVRLEELMAKFPGEISILPTKAEDIVKLEYPVLEYPMKINALNLDKTPTIQGVLKGIKGQYLILDSGVMSVWKFAGYKVAFTSS